MAYAVARAVTAVTLLKRTGDAILIPTTASAIGSLACYRLHASECDHVLAKNVASWQAWPGALQY